MKLFNEYVKYVHIVRTAEKIYNTCLAKHEQTPIHIMLVILASSDLKEAAIEQEINPTLRSPALLIEMVESYEAETKSKKNLQNASGEVD